MDSHQPEPRSATVEEVDVDIGFQVNLTRRTLYLLMLTDLILAYL
jgi:hypothetical protein